jgi:hypothetical protein
VTATFSLAELRQQGYELRDGRLVRVVPNGVIVGPGGAAVVPDDEESNNWKDAQAECRRVFVDGGCEVYWLSQARKSGQTPGLPDLIVFGPPGAPFLLMWETKSGHGKLSDAQRKFALHCQRTSTRYAAGGPTAARRTLKQLLEEYRK